MSDNKETINLIKQVIKTIKEKENAQETLKKLKEACKIPENRQEFILNDLHLYLRDVYRSNLFNQFLILESIYLISLERDFCDELAILGSLIDEGYSFLLTNLRQYKGKEEENIMESNLEKLDNDTLLQLDLWIRIFVNFFKNQEVVDYVASAKGDITLYLIIFIRKIDSTIDIEDNIQQINSLIIVSNLKKNVTECLTLLCYNETLNQYLLNQKDAYKWVVKTLMEGAENLTQFCNLCLLFSQMCQSQDFDYQSDRKNLIEEIIFRYMIGFIYNDHIQSDQWKNILEEKKERPNFVAELAISRGFYYLSQQKRQRYHLMKICNKYKETIFIRYLVYLCENQQWDATIYISLGVATLCRHEHLEIPKYLGETNPYIQFITESIIKNNKIAFAAFTKLLKFMKREEQQSNFIQDLIRQYLQKKLKKEKVEFKQQNLDSIVYELAGQQIQVEKYKLNESYNFEPDQNSKDKLDTQHSHKDLNNEADGIHHLLIENPSLLDTQSEQDSQSDISKKSKKKKFDELNMKTEYLDSLDDSEIFRAKIRDSKLDIDDDVEHFISENIKFFYVKKIKQEKSKNTDKKEKGKLQMQEYDETRLFMNDANQEARLNLHPKMHCRYCHIMFKNLLIYHEKHFLTQIFDPITFKLYSKNITYVPDSDDDESDLDQNDYEQMNTEKHDIKHEIFLSVIQFLHDMSLTEIINESIIDSLCEILQNDKTQYKQKLPILLLFSHFGMVSLETTENMQNFQMIKCLDYQVSQLMGAFGLNPFTLLQSTKNEQKAEEILDYVKQQQQRRRKTRRLKTHFLTQFQKQQQNEEQQQIEEQKQNQDNNKNDSQSQKNSQNQSEEKKLDTSQDNESDYYEGDQVEIQQRDSEKIKEHQKKLKEMYETEPNDTEENDPSKPMQTEGSLHPHFIVNKEIITQKMLIQYLVNDYKFETEIQNLNEQEGKQYMQLLREKKLINDPDHDKNYSTIFVLLHDIYHLQLLVYRLIKRGVQTKNNNIIPYAADIMIQLLQLLKFFRQINTINEPIHPFMKKTKCFEEIKDLINMNLEKTISVIRLVQIDQDSIGLFYEHSKNNVHIPEILNQASNFSISAANSLFKMLFYFYTYKRKNHVEDFGEFDRVTFLEMLQFLANINNSQPETVRFFDEEVQFPDKDYLQSKNKSYFDKLVKFLVITIQTLAQFLGTNIFNEDAISTEESMQLKIRILDYIDSLNRFFILFEKVQKVYRKNDPGYAKYEKEIVAVNGKKQQYRQKHIRLKKQPLHVKIEDFKTSFTFFINELSKKELMGQMILATKTFQNVTKNYQQYEFDEDATFCYAASIHNFCKIFQNFDQIAQPYRGFHIDICNVVYYKHMTKVNILPILRGIRILLKNRKRDYLYFREMIPKLRELSDLQNKIEQQQLKENLKKLDVSDIEHVQVNDTIVNQTNPTFLKYQNQNQTKFNQEELTFLSKIEENNESIDQSVEQEIKSYQHLTEKQRNGLINEIVNKEVIQMLKMLTLVTQGELKTQIKQKEQDQHIKKEKVSIAAGLMSEKTKKEEIVEQKFINKIMKNITHPKEYEIDPKPKENRWRHPIEYKSSYNYIPKQIMETPYDKYIQSKDSDNKDIIQQYLQSEKIQYENMGRYEKQKILNIPINMDQTWDDDLPSQAHIKMYQDNSMSRRSSQLSFYNKMQQQNQKNIIDPKQFEHSQQEIEGLSIIKKAQDQFKQGKMSDSQNDISRVNLSGQFAKYNNYDTRSVINPDISSNNVNMSMNNSRSQQSFSIAKKFPQSNDNKVLKSAANNILYDVDTAYRQILEKQYQKQNPY